jgi:hypothetical protein
VRDGGSDTAAEGAEIPLKAGVGEKSSAAAAASEIAATSITDDTPSTVSIASDKIIKNESKAAGA